MAGNTRCGVSYAADRGAVTAEFAVIMPAVIIVASLVLYMAHISNRTIVCQDAAANVACMLVVHDAHVDATGMVHATAGAGAGVTVHQSGRQFTVTTQCPVTCDPWSVLPSSVTGSATGVRP